MSVFSFARAACLVSGVLASGFVVAAQAAPWDPNRFVASIYGNGREGVLWSQWLDGARRREWFSHALTALGELRRVILDHYYEIELPCAKNIALIPDYKFRKVRGIARIA